MGLGEPSSVAPPSALEPPARGVPRPAYSYQRLQPDGPQAYYAAPMGAVSLSPLPIVGLAIRGPRVPPHPGSVVIGYEIVDQRQLAGCFRCEGLNLMGIVSVILLLFVCWPLAWLPCIMPECFEPFQRPVYGTVASPIVVMQQGPPPPPPAGAYPSAPPAYY